MCILACMMCFGMYIHKCGLFSHQDASSSGNLPVKMPHLWQGESVCMLARMLHVYVFWYIRTYFWAL